MTRSAFPHPALKPSLRYGPSSTRSSHDTVTFAASPRMAVASFVAASTFSARCSLRQRLRSFNGWRLASLRRADLRIYGLPGG